MRSVRSEVLSAAVVLSVPLALVAVFPFGVFGFRAAERVAPPVRNAFVQMTPTAEGRALRAVRASLREKGGGARRLQADLLLAELPEDPYRSVLSLRDRSRPPAPPMAACERTPFLPSLKAPPPSPIAAGGATEQLAFPREDLLKMN